MICRTLALNVRSYIDCINLHSKGGYYDPGSGAALGLNKTPYGDWGNKKPLEILGYIVLEYSLWGLGLTNHIPWNMVESIFHHPPSGVEGKNIRVQKKYSAWGLGLTNHIPRNMVGSVFHHLPSGFEEKNSRVQIIKGMRNKDR